MAFELVEIIDRDCSRSTQCGFGTRDDCLLIWSGRARSRARLNTTLCVKSVSGGLSMTVPVWMMLGFATWTALLLLFTIGIYRWSRILSGRAVIRNFPADATGGRNGIGARRGLTRTASKIFRCSVRLSLDSTLVTWRAHWSTPWQRRSLPPGFFNR